MQSHTLGAKGSCQIPGATSRQRCPDSRAGACGTAASVGERSEQDLREVDTGGVPREVRPLVDALNRLLLRIRSALQTERRFTAATYARHVELFPEGQWVVLEEATERVVGSTSTSTLTLPSALWSTVAVVSISM